ncbi:P-loop NTPase fold protein [Roseomonas sp. F4]
MSSAPENPAPASGARAAKRKAPKTFRIASIQPIWLGNAGNIRLDAALNHWPWDLNGEAFVLPLGPLGQMGEIAAQFVKRTQNADFGQHLQEVIGQHGLSPDKPVMWPFEKAAGKPGEARSMLLATAFTPDEEVVSARAIRGILNACRDHGIASLVLPLPGIGRGRADPQEAAETVVAVCGRDMTPTSLRRITLTTASDEAFAALLDLASPYARFAHPDDAEHSEQGRAVTGTLKLARFVTRTLSGFDAGLVTAPAFTVGVIEAALDMVEASPTQLSGDDALLGEAARSQPGALQRLRDGLPRMMEPQPYYLASEAADLWNAALGRRSTPSTLGLADLAWAILEKPGPELSGVLAAAGFELPVRPVAAAKPIGFRPTIPGIGADDVGAGGLVDCLGMEQEARAFGRLVAARGMRPPLAIGVFGPWGSGKSFFLRQLHEAVEDCAMSAARLPPDRRDENPFHAGIVQIRFNAWHYVDTNLWASLVTHIFTELDRWVMRQSSPDAAGEAAELFERLATARTLSLEAARQLVRRRQDLRQATVQFAAAETALAEARAATSPGPRDVALAAWATLQNSSPDRAALLPQARAALGRLGIAPLADDAAAVRDAAAHLLETGDALARNGTSTYRMLCGAAGQAFIWFESCRLWQRLAMLAPAVLLVGGLILGPALLVDSIQNWLGGLPALTASLSALLVGAAGAAGWAEQRAQKALAQLRAFDAALREAVEHRQAETSQGQAAKLAAERLAKAQAEEAEARQLLAATTERAAEAARLFDGGTGRSRLYRFVRERAAAEDYRRHVGLVAAVRRDFEELATAMASAEADDEVTARAERHREWHAREVAALVKEAEDSGALLSAAEIEKLRQGVQAAAKDPVGEGFARIVLYIDDLDRCPAEKVVEVLQAVHLLLTFPLFVAVVAADIRWVSRALLRHFPELLDDGARPGAGHAATPYDYLEKIFQIPYWVRPMDGATATLLLDRRSVALDSHRPAAGPYRTTPFGEAPKRDEASDPASGATPDEAASTDESGSAGQTYTEAGAAANATETQAGSGQPDIGPPADWLSLDAVERDFMTLLAPHLGGSPRQILRFLNVYRVIRGSLHGDALRGFVGRDSHALMLHLALGCAGKPQPLDFDKADSIAALRAGLPPDSSQAKLLELYEARSPADDGSDTFATLRAWTKPAARYSFSG